MAEAVAATAIREFGATSTTEDVLSGINLRGKRILVTGVSAGLGVETARSLAAHGANVVGTARDLAKAEAATAQVRKDAAANGGSFELVELDLASSESVRNCANQLLRKGEAFDVIIANAGVMATPFSLHHRPFRDAIRHQSPGPLRPGQPDCPATSRKGGRLINLSSSGHRFSNVDLDDPNFEKTPYDPFVAYGRSKTANILFAVAFDQRHRERGVRAAAVHPGGIQTELGRHMEPGAIERPDRPNEQTARGRGQGALPVEDHPARSGNFGVGRGSCSGRRDRRPILRKLPRRQDRARRRDHQRHKRRSPRLRARSQSCRGALEEKRRNGRRIFLALSDATNQEADHEKEGTQ